MEPEIEDDKLTREQLLEQLRNLRASEQVLRSFFDSPGYLRGVVEIVGNDIVHVAGNCLSTECFGIASEKLCIEPEELHRLWIRHFMESRGRKTPVRFEFVLKRPIAVAGLRAYPDEVRNMSATVSWLGDSAYPSVYIGKSRFAYVVEDVTERVRKEQFLIRQSRLSAMGETIVIIAHQLKQPLSVISAVAGYVLEAFGSGELTQSQMEDAVANIGQRVNSISRTIDNFRNFLKPSAQIVEFNLYAAVREILGMFKSLFKRFNIAIYFEGGDGDETLNEAYKAVGNPGEFQHVILNMMNNSRDAINALREKGLMSVNTEGKIIIVMGKTQSGNETLTRITIADNGGGIPVEVIDRVFEQYFTTKVESTPPAAATPQAQTSASSSSSATGATSASQEKGTGLGLYMAKIIIEKNMGGKLSVRNVPGGAEFTILIPQAPEAIQQLPQIGPGAEIETIEKKKND